MKPQGQQHQNSAPSHAMSVEAQRIAIAEACGWKREVQFSEVLKIERVRWIAPNDNKSGIFLPPDYTNDLNAMNEAEKVLTPGQHYTFRRALWQVTDSKSPSSFPWTLGEVNGEEHNRRYCSATAAQRAEAFLRTIGKWTAEEQGVENAQEKQMWRHLNP